MLPGYSLGRPGQRLAGHADWIAAALDFDGWAPPWSRRLLPFARWMPGAGDIGVRMAAPFGVKDTALPDWIAAQVRDAAGTAGAGAVLHLRDLLQVRRLALDTRRRLPDITAPTLLLHAQHDDVASSHSAYGVGRRIWSKQVTWQLFANSYHQLGIDTDKPLVLAALLAQLDHLASGPMLLDTLDNPGDQGHPGDQG